ncbi:hypothetical protein TGPRC2_424840, partial [Toxoplasma gondii TgCatPRC2]
MFSGLFRFCRSVFFCFVFPWKLSRFLWPSEPQTSFFSGVAFESLFALSGDMAASCSLQNASTTTRFLVGFTVLASILFALSPAVSSLPALSFAAAQVEAGVQTAFQSFDAHESSQEEAEQGNQFLERLRPKSAAARRTQDPEAGDGLIHEQGLTDDRTIVIKPRAGRGEQVKTTFQKSLRITRG